jgi:tetratricopeptide (TPR) repeat protein
MRTTSLPILLAASAAFAFAAHAQEAPAFMNIDPPTPGAESNPGLQPGGGWQGDPVMPCCDLTDIRRERSLGDGVAALEASDFARAEEILARNLRYNKNNDAVRFYLGVAKMNLGKWDEAKRNLKIAARELRKLPDPKGHLGVTYAKLGDIAGANAQRARLVKMAEACKGDCKLSPYITSGIQMIDEALAEAAVPNQG